MCVRWALVSGNTIDLFCWWLLCQGGDSLRIRTLHVSSVDSIYLRYKAVNTLANNPNIFFFFFKWKYFFFFLKKFLSPIFYFSRLVFSVRFWEEDPGPSLLLFFWKNLHFDIHMCFLYKKIFLLTKGVLRVPREGVIIYSSEKVIISNKAMRQV